MKTMSKRTYFAGSKTFVNEDLIIDMCQKIYKVTDKIIWRRVNMLKLICEFPFYASVQNTKQFYLFIYALLDEIPQQVRLGDEIWSQMDRSDTFKYDKFQQINQKVWEELNSPSKDRLQFVTIFMKYKQSFIESEDSEVRQDVKNFLDKVERYFNLYYAPLFDDYLNQKYGLVINGSMGLYFPTDEYVALDSIPAEIKENTFDLKTRLIKGRKCLDGCYAFIYNVKEHKKVALGLKRAHDFENIKEIKCDDEWQIGIPIKAPTRFPNLEPIMYNVLPNTFLTDIDGRRLLSRFAFEDDRLNDKGRLWWQDNTLLKQHFLRREDGTNYGIETVFFIITSFGNINRIMRCNVHLESFELKRGLTRL